MENIVPVTPPKKKPPTWVIVAIVAVIAIAIGLGVYFNKKPKKEEETTTGAPTPPGAPTITGVVPTSNPGLIISFTPSSDVGVGATSYANYKISLINSDEMENPTEDFMLIDNQTIPAGGR